jgi:hypothetical protein
MFFHLMHKHQNRFFGAALMFIALASLFSCKENSFQSGTVIYSDTVFNGRYNKAGFDVNLNNIPSHNKIIVSFDLYIHDSWDGNNGGIDGPDFWQMKVDGRTVIYTTFSNRFCEGFSCGSQSYPSNYLVNNYPATGREAIELKGACVLGNERGTSLYKIVRVVPHSGADLSINFRDFLKQSNAADSFQLCDESWSIDNLEIKANTVSIQ